MDFYELDLNDHVLDALDDMNFTDCTPIQEHAIPAILEGRDLIGVAQTGTGKTAAYLLPVLSQMCDNPGPDNKISCIIMSPTRELAQQIDQSLAGFSYYVPVSSVAVYGGNDGIRYEQERKGLTMGADIIIATPGRLISHLSLSNIDLSGVRYFILDEADRMLDMGFSDDIMQIVKMLPAQRQTILFSATMPAKIQQLARNILTDPVEIKIAVSRPAEKIRQEVVFCCETEKLKAAEWLFTNHPTERVIIFASSKLKVKEITRALLRKGFNVGEMHSDLDQKERDSVMYAFKTQQIGILVATDIVARGIDIDDIQLVVNYDLPHDAEDYVHRIGRTARANNDGNAVTLVSEKEYSGFRRMEKQLEIEVPVTELPENFTRPDLKLDWGNQRKKSRKKKASPANAGHRKKEEKNSAAISQQEISNEPVPADESKTKPKRRKRRRKPASAAAGSTPETSAKTDAAAPVKRYHRHRRRKSSESGGEIASTPSDTAGNNSSNKE